MANAVMECMAGQAGWEVPAPRPVPTGDEWIWEDADEPAPVAPRLVIPEQVVRDLAGPVPASAGAEPVRDGSVPEQLAAEQAVPAPAGAEPVRRGWAWAEAGPVVPEQAEPVDGPVRELVPGPRHGRRCGFTFAALPSTPRWARALVGEALCGWGMEPYADAAELLVSELATNAVRAGSAEIVVRVTAASGKLRIEVADDGAGRPRPADPGPEAEDGHGLMVVAAISADWGTYQLGTAGKVVWCEIPEPAAG